MISQYWVAERPTDPLLIEVTDQDGNAIDLSGFTINIEILDPDNYELSVSDFTVTTSLLNEGKLTIIFPSGRSIFEKTGEYLLRLKLSNSNGIDYSTSYGMKVSEFGGDEVHDLGVVI